MNLSIKNVPEDVIERLREKAKRNHRSMQEEMLAILEEASGPKRLSVQEATREIKKLNFRTGDEATAWIREDRDAR